jgi:hypothetical protein
MEYIIKFELNRIFPAKFSIGKLKFLHKKKGLPSFRLTCFNLLLLKIKDSIEIVVDNSITIIENPVNPVYWKLVLDRIINHQVNLMVHLTVFRLSWIFKINNYHRPSQIKLIHRIIWRFFGDLDIMRMALTKPG